MVFYSKPWRDLASDDLVWPLWIGSLPYKKETHQSSYDKRRIPAAIPIGQTGGFRPNSTNKYAPGSLGDIIDITGIHVEITLIVEGNDFSLIHVVYIEVEVQKYWLVVKKHDGAKGLLIWLASKPLRRQADDAIVQLEQHSNEILSVTFYLKSLDVSHWLSLISRASHKSRINWQTSQGLISQPWSTTFRVLIFGSTLFLLSTLPFGPLRTLHLLAVRLHDAPVLYACYESPSEIITSSFTASNSTLWSVIICFISGLLLTLLFVGGALVAPVSIFSIQGNYIHTYRGD